MTLVWDDNRGPDLGGNASQITRENIVRVNNGNTSNLNWKRGGYLIILASNDDDTMWQFICGFNNYQDSNVTISGPCWYIYHETYVNDHYGFKLYNKFNEFITYVGPQVCDNQADINETVNKKGRYILNNLIIPLLEQVRDNNNG